MYFDWTVFILLGAMVITFVAQGSLRSAYSTYSNIACASSLTGSQAANIILRRHGLTHVPIGYVQGELSDHYSPRERSLSLSPAIFAGNSIASVAVAAHECGHALQHSEGYVPLKIRSALAIPATIASNAAWFLLIGGIIIEGAGYVTEGCTLFDAGIIAFCAVVAFQLITLPVEFNASRRAIVELQECGIIIPDEVGLAQKMLRAAAMTYVASLAVSLAHLLRLILLRGRR